MQFGKCREYLRSLNNPIISLVINQIDSKFLLDNQRGSVHNLSPIEYV